MSATGAGPAAIQAGHHRRFGVAWLLLTAAIALHVTDEALTGFLRVYNPTILEIRQRLPWFPIRPFAFRGWLEALIIGIVLLLLLSPLAFRSARGTRPVAAVLSVLMILNACGHTLGTVLGRTFADIHFARPMPGFYSSPFLFAAAINLLIAVRRESRAARIAKA
jgi:hypothetical protein